MEVNENYALVVFSPKFDSIKCPYSAFCREKEVQFSKLITAIDPVFLNPNFSFHKIPPEMLDLRFIQQSFCFLMFCAKLSVKVEPKSAFLTLTGCP